MRLNMSYIDFSHVGYNMHVFCIFYVQKMQFQGEKFIKYMKKLVLTSGPYRYDRYIESLWDGMILLWYQNRTTGRVYFLEEIFLVPR